MPVRLPLVPSDSCKTAAGILEGGGFFLTPEVEGLEGVFFVLMFTFLLGMLMCKWKRFYWYVNA